MTLLDRRFKAYPQSGHADWKTWFYLVAQLIGSAGLTILLLTMLWPTQKRKPRNPVLVSLCFSWWFSTFPCLLILYYAREILGPEPSPSVCLASAVMTMSQSVLVALTALALILNIWLAVQGAVKAGFVRPRSIGAWTIACVAFPWIIALIFALSALGTGLKNPQTVHRALFYCIVDNDGLTTAIGVFGCIVVAAAIFFEIWILVLLRKNRSSLKQLSRGRNGLDISLIFRVCVFGLYVLLGLCLQASSIVDWANPIPDLFFATFSIGVFIVFGTQPDIWRIWRDVSRQVTSSRSVTTSFGSQNQDISRYPPTFTMSMPSPANTQPPLMRSVSFANQQKSPIAVPLPAAFRSRDTKTPPLVIHTTTEVYSHTEASTPNTGMSYKTPESMMWGQQDDDYRRSEVELNEDEAADDSLPSVEDKDLPPPHTQGRATPASFLPLSMSDDESMMLGPPTGDLLSHSYPPSPAYMSGGWILQPPVAPHSRESLAPSEAPPGRGESPVWHLDMENRRSDDEPHAI